MMEYMIGISIGPVQGFIAAARKTRDLWFGSFMLSEISKAIAIELRSKGCELIFPPDDCLKPDVPVANRIFGILESDNISGIDKIVRDAAAKKLDEYKRMTLDNLKSISIDNNQFDSQLDNFLDIFIAWYPYNNDYAETRKMLDQLLAGRKALRDFKPSNGKAGIPKSSLDGGLDSVINNKDDTDIRMKKGELLDAMSLIKRLAEPRRFISVARIASDGFIRNLSANHPDSLEKLVNLAEKMDGISEYVQKFKAENFKYSSFGNFPFDTELLFKEIKEIDNDEIREKDFVNTLKEICNKCEISHPFPYFAVLAADGDHMGAAITSLDTKEKHVEFSKALAEFTKKADEIVGKHNGALVYSGGDDVLAFLPLDKALHCADELRNEFTSILRNVAKDDLTMSCGISIAHFNEHLQNLLSWGHDAERNAKDNGRDSLAVHLHTRSAGNEYAGTVHKWSEAPFAEWTTWIDMHQAGLISEGFAYELRKLLEEFQNIDDPAILYGEAKRIINRKMIKKGKEKVSDETINKLLPDSMCENTTSKELAAKIERMTQGLIISKHIAKALKTAGVDWKGEINV